MPAPKPPSKPTSALRRNLGPLILLLGAILTAFIIMMGLSGHTPTWFVAIATVL